MAAFQIQVSLVVLRRLLYTYYYPFDSDCSHCRTPSAVGKEPLDPPAVLALAASNLVVLLALSLLFIVAKVVFDSFHVLLGIGPLAGDPHRVWKMLRLLGVDNSPVWDASLP